MTNFYFFYFLALVSKEWPENHTQFGGVVIRIGANKMVSFVIEIELLFHARLC
jgi:hypothetical protein